MSGLKGALVLVVSLLPMVASAVVGIPAERDEAREMVKMLSDEINQQSGQAMLSEKIGERIGVSSKVDDGCLVFEYLVPGYKPQSEYGANNLTRFSIASGRNNGTIGSSISLLCDLLRVAGYDLKAVYSNEDGVVNALRMTPDEWQKLVTLPMSELGIDMDAALNELIANMQTSIDAEAQDMPSVRPGKMRLDGSYIVVPMLIDGADAEGFFSSGVSDRAIKDVMLSYMLMEGGAPFFMTSLVNVGRNMELSGIKFDMRSLTGAQKVLNVGWDELLFAISNPSQTPIIDLFVSSVASSLEALKRDGDSPVADAYARYKEPFVEILTCFDVDSESLNELNLVELKAQTMADMVDSDFQETVRDMTAEGFEGLRYIYTDVDRTVRRVIEITAKEILDYNPPTGKSFGDM